MRRALCQIRRCHGLGGAPQHGLMACMIGPRVQPLLGRLCIRMPVPCPICAARILGVAPGKPAGDLFVGARRADSCWLALGRAGPVAVVRCLPAPVLGPAFGQAGDGEAHGIARVAMAVRASDQCLHPLLQFGALAQQGIELRRLVQNGLSRRACRFRRLLRRGDLAFQIPPAASDHPLPT